MEVHSCTYISLEIAIVKKNKKKSSRLPRYPSIKIHHNTLDLCWRHACSDFYLLIQKTARWAHIKVRPSRLLVPEPISQQWPKFQWKLKFATRSYKLHFPHLLCQLFHPAAAFGKLPLSKKVSVSPPGGEIPFCGISNPCPRGLGLCCRCCRPPWLPRRL